MADEKTIPSAVPKGEKRWLDPSRWGELEDQSASGTIIKTMSLCKMVEGMMPEFRCAIWDDEDLHRKISEGWEVLTENHWNEVEEWNATVAGRHGIVPKDGGFLVPNHGWLCILPRDLRYRRWKRQREREEARVKQQFGAIQKDVNPAARAEGRLEVKMSRAGHPDAEVATLASEQGGRPAE